MSVVPKVSQTPEGEANWPLFMVTARITKVRSIAEAPTTLALVTVRSTGTPMMARVSASKSGRTAARTSAGIEEAMFSAGPVTVISQSEAFTCTASGSPIGMGLFMLPGSPEPSMLTPDGKVALLLGAMSWSDVPTASTGVAPMGSRENSGLMVPSGTSKQAMPVRVAPGSIWYSVCWRAPGTLSHGKVLYCIMGLDTVSAATSTALQKYGAAVPFPEGASTRTISTGNPYRYVPG